jgi:hypothetical protein
MSERWVKAILFCTSGIAVGGLAGFCAPFVVYPEGGQGPGLYAVFVTGPLSAIGGGVLGAVAGLVLGRQRGGGAPEEEKETV